MSNSHVVAALVGLCVAWGGTALLVSPLGRVLGDPERIASKCRGQLALWMLLGTVLAIVMFWEKESLDSLWLRPLAWRSLAWGLLLAVATVSVVIPAREWVRRTAGLGGYPAGMAKVLSLPMWFRVAAVVTAGVVEETLFNGFAVTRLALLTGSLWLAGALSVTVFAGLHVPFWGAGPALSFLIGGAASTAFFIWRQDLLAMIVAHVAIDAWGLVITPLYSEWWKERRFSS
jgi:membrane protease YdiL (CAAX protease family)